MFEFLLFTLISFPLALSSGVWEKGHSEALLKKLCLAIIGLYWLFDHFVYSQSEVIWAGLLAYALVIHSSAYIKVYFVISMAALWLISGTITSVVNGVSDATFTNLQASSMYVACIQSVTIWVIGIKIFPEPLKAIRNKFFSIVLCLFWIMSSAFVVTSLPKESIELAFSISRFSFVTATLLITVLIYRGTKTAVRYYVIDQTVVSHLEAALITIDDLNEMGRSVNRHSLGDTENIGIDATQRLIDGLADYITKFDSAILTRINNVKAACESLLSEIENEANLHKFAKLQEMLISLMNQTVNPLITSSQAKTLTDTFMPLVHRADLVAENLYKELREQYEALSIDVHSSGNMSKERAQEMVKDVKERTEILLAGRPLRRYLSGGRETTQDQNLESLLYSISEIEYSIKSRNQESNFQA